MVKVSEKKMGVLISYFNLFISMIIPLFYTPIMLDLLGKSEYGLLSVAQSVIAYLSLMNFGMSTTVIRYLNKYRGENNKDGIKRIIALFIVIYLFLAMLICIVGFSIPKFSGVVFQKGLTSSEISKLNILIILLTINVPIGFLTNVFGAVIFSYEKFIFKYFIDTIGTIMAPILNLIALINGFASVGIVLVSLIWQIFLLVLFICYCKVKFNIYPDFKHIPFHMTKELFSFSGIIFLSAIADLLFWSTDKVLIGATIGTTSVAIYNIGNTFTTMFQNMSSVVSTVFSIEANKIVFTNQSIDESSKLLIKVGRIQYLIVSLILSGFIVFGKSFVMFWAGKGYELSYYIALITMIPLTIPMIQTIAFNTIVALGKHLFRSKIYICIAIINVISTYLILPYCGIVGAALCTGLAFIIGQGIILNYYYYKEIKLDIVGFWKNIFYMTRIPAFMAILTSIIIKSISFNGLLELLIGILLYTFIFIVLTWKYTMNEYEKSIFLGMIKRIKKQY